jgi:hypothetical protein
MVFKRHNSSGVHFWSRQLPCSASTATSKAVLAVEKFIQEHLQSLLLDSSLQRLT